MTVRRRAILPAVFGLALSACSQLAPPGSASATSDANSGPAGGVPAVEVREHLSGRFIALIGPKAQHAPLYLGIPGTNFYCLRSFVDRKTGETADQLYVSDSYDGTERNWDAARYSAGQGLTFIPISHDKIACDRGCSYLEEFAANIPENELRTSPTGLSVIFVDHAGEQKTINVSADQIAAQLAAVDAQQNAVTSRAASAGPPLAAAHQP
jgi:hypothetical protein